MAINQVQFQKGLSMAEFMDRYGTRDRCEALLIAWRWPDGFVCRECRLQAHSSFRRDSRRYRVEMDDAYLGGELVGGASGRGSENKVSFAATVQTTESGQPV